MRSLNDHCGKLESGDWLEPLANGLSAIDICGDFQKATTRMNESRMAMEGRRRWDATISSNELLE